MCLLLNIFGENTHKTGELGQYKVKIKKIK